MLASVERLPSVVGWERLWPVLHDLAMEYQRSEEEAEREIEALYRDIGGEG